MTAFERLQSLIDRLASYSPLEVAIELLLIGLVVYGVLRFAQGTRAAGALKGLFLVLVVATLFARVLGGGEAFQRLTFLYDRFLTIAAVGLLIIFQPELRRALIRLGEAPFFRSTPSEIAEVVDSIADASSYLSKSKFGAIIVVERQVGLQGIVEGGTPLGAKLSARLLQTIFFPGTALHDLAVVIKGRVVSAAGVQLPLADPAEMPDARLGSRHRAAVGLSNECDALVIVVSEETGHIRIAERGRLSESLTTAGLREELTRRLHLEPPSRELTAEETATQETLARTETGDADRAKEPAA